MVTPINPELSLALSVASGPGVYALLLGSGISRSAGIPTGWEVVLDLVRQVAVAEGADPEPDPETWYASKFGESPGYSTLLEQLGPQAAERQTLLQRYFEATDDEREEKTRRPTAAHHAIASLVAAGWIRVIVTTNFDRLLESALEAADVAPIVISTADLATGAPPLAHSRCTVIKVHGDYLDTRIKNSDDELASYEAPMDALLDRVFDEYGLVVCGWSGAYDVALRAALQRCMSRRYTTYWCVHGSMSPVAEKLVDYRAAQLVQIENADSFFPRLLERVTTIHESGEPHPLETRVAVETLKRYLPDDRHRIRLRELVREDTEELIADVDAATSGSSTVASAEELLGQAQKLNALCERSLALTANGCYWGRSEQDDVWLRTLRRLAELDPPQDVQGNAIHMRRYPALLTLYAAGIASVAVGRYHLLAALLLAPTSPFRGESQVIVQSVFPPQIVGGDAARVLFPHEDARTTYKTPRSRYLYRELRPVFADLIPAEREYVDVFDRFECLTSLVHADVYNRKYSSFIFAGGCFEWRTLPSGRLPLQAFRQEIEEARDQWPPLQAGFFGRSLERVLEVVGAVEQRVAPFRL